MNKCVTCQVELNSSRKKYCIPCKKLYNKEYWHDRYAKIREEQIKNKEEIKPKWCISCFFFNFFRKMHILCCLY